MKKLFYIIPVLVVILFIVFYLDIFKNKPEDAQTDRRMDTVELYINQGRVDSAFSLLQHILINPKDSQTYDSALSLQLQIQKIVLLDLKGSHIDVLLQLTAEEYDDLRKHDLDKNFLNHPILNKMYIKKLYEKSEKNSESPLPEYSETSLPDADQRKEYAGLLRETYSDLGFEIRVTVSGPDNHQLNLRSPVFDETWFAKFDSGGDLEAWHTMGFTRIQIENGSDYIRLKEWK